MTRNEFIATTAARLLASGTWQPDGARDEAIAMCDALERGSVQPWQTPPAAPDLSALERAVVDAAVAWWRNRNPETVGALALAVARHLDATTRAAP